MSTSACRQDHIGSVQNQGHDKTNDRSKYFVCFEPFIRKWTPYSIWLLAGSRFIIRILRSQYQDIMSPIC